MFAGKLNTSPTHPYHSFFRPDHKDSLTDEKPATALKGSLMGADGSPVVQCL